MGAGGIAAAVGVMIGLLVAGPGTATAFSGQAIDDAEKGAEAQIQNASIAAEGYLQEAEDLRNEAVWMVAEPVLGAYATAIQYWPRTTPAYQLAGFEGGSDVPAPPVNPESTFAPYAPDEYVGPSEHEVRDKVKMVAGDQTHDPAPGPDPAPANETARYEEPLASDPAPGSTPSTPSMEPGPGPIAATPPTPWATTASQANRVPVEALVVVAVASLVGALAAWLLSHARGVGRLIAGAPTSALFSRQTGADVLRHPVRSQIHAAISQNAGITSVALGHLTGFTQSVLRYHLGVLCREKLVRVARRGKIYHYYDVGGLDEEARARECLFWRGRSWLATAILKHPGSSQQDVAKLAGLPASRVCDYTKELAEAGLVRSERVGRCRRYFPTARLESMLPEHASL